MNLPRKIRARLGPFLIGPIVALLTGRDAILNWSQPTLVSVLFKILFALSLGMLALLFFI
jgi:hypothetical protein